MPMHHTYTETKQTILSTQKRQNISNEFKQVDINFSMTMQEHVEQVKDMNLFIITALQIIPSTLSPTMTTVEISLHVQVGDHILQTRHTHHRYPETL
jgi:hypothetical protein